MILRLPTKHGEIATAKKNGMRSILSNCTSPVFRLSPHSHGQGQCQANVKSCPAAAQAHAAHAVDSRAFQRLSKKPGYTGC